MERILVLLEERNKYLTKFLIVTEEEEKNFQNGNFDGIDRFYETRENLLEMVNQIEKLMDKHLAFEDETQITTELRRGVNLSLKLRDEVINRILDTDLRVLSLIEETKSKMLKELNNISRGRKVVSKYHSGTTDSILDEEA